MYKDIKVMQAECGLDKLNLLLQEFGSNFANFPQVSLLIKRLINITAAIGTSGLELPTK
ncbi:hypothetical protein [Neobacillus sp. 204]|uniref:hypothetical protein n=1 Tax=Neobacillus sp. 204 TaxID=3383351 RepID=UPI0039798788